MSKYGSIKVGSKVRAMRELRNGSDIIPAGSVGRVEKLYSGLTVYFENKCTNCGFGGRFWISRVPPSDVELVKDE